MPLAEALAVAPRLQTCEQDPENDRRALGRLARWLERYSPIVGMEEAAEPQSLLLDITGCADYFHGEDQLLRQAVEELSANGWIARIAIADTLGAAWGLAHYASTPVLAAAGETERMLHPLPIAALRLPAVAREALIRLGMATIGQLLALPRPDLPARFGPEVLQRLDQALGRLPEVVTPYRYLPEVQAYYRFEFPTDRRDVLDHVLDQVTQRVETVLRERGWGAKRVECWLYQESAQPVRLEVSLCRPNAEADHLGMLLRHRLEQTALTGPVRTVWLRVRVAEPVPGRQGEFFETGLADGEELSILLDRLSNSLGREAVTRVTVVPDPQPEYACRFEPVVSAGGKTDATALEAHFSPQFLRVFVHRPLRLWPQPQAIEVTSVVPDGPPIRFRWAGTDYGIASARGPERIETGWWRGQDVRRDYYAVLTRQGTRFWIFRQRDDGRWFLHGCFE